MGDAWNTKEAKTEQPHDDDPGDEGSNFEAPLQKKQRAVLNYALRGLGFRV